MNAVTASRQYTGIPSIRRNDSIHISRLSSIGRAVTEQEAQEIEKEPTAQSTSGAISKKSLRFSKVCEVITLGEKKDEVRLHLFHYFQNRPKNVPPTAHDANVDKDKTEIEQGQTKDSKAENHHWHGACGSRRGPDWGLHLNGKDGGLTA